MALEPIRPRFRLEVPGTVEQTVGSLQAAVDAPDSGCVSRVVGRHVDITVDRDRRHRWSPCVQLELERSGDAVVIHGLIGPHPSVWALFAFVYITVGLATFFGLMLGVVQWSLGLDAWGLWSAPLGLAASLALYAASQVGQRLAAEQTELLARLVRRALDL